MEPKSQKQSMNENNTSDRSLKKYLVVATMAASLGVSLGVPVGDVLAQNEKMESPPGYTTQDKQSLQTERMQSSRQSDKGKKMVAPQKKESTQFKFDQQVDPKTRQNQINR